MTQEVAAYYDEVAETYDSAYRRPIDLAEDCFASGVLRRHIDETSFVLDVGCGTGHLLKLMGKKQPRLYVGTDISDGMLSVARERYGALKRPNTFEKVDMMRLPWSAQEFDVVTCLNEVSVYTDDFDRLVENMFMACRTLCIMSVPLPRHAGRKTLAQTAPGKHYLELDEMLESLHRLFFSVRVTPYSSPIHDMLPLPALRLTGVRAPRQIAYYAMIEAWV